MRRDPASLGSTVRDVVVVGGGIHGCAAAWEAASRGLDTALVERDDFGGAASANSLKTVHGGLRYLQTADLRRMRRSIAERSALLRIAPHLVAPLGFLVPAAGWGSRGRLAFRVAFALADLAGFDRNRGLRTDRRLPAGRVLDRAGVAATCSWLPATAGALWHDAQMLDSERLTFAFVQAAVEAGAVAANHCEARHLLRDGERVIGVRVLDRLDGSEHDVRARTIVLAGGAWNAGLLDAAPGPRIAAPRPAAAVAWNVVLRGRRTDVAVGFRSPLSPADDPVCGGGRFVFVVPWRNSTMLGTAYRAVAAADATPTVTTRDVESLVRECREALPGLDLSTDDVTLVHRGYVPLKAGMEAGRGDALAERAAVVDHAAGEGPAGLLTITGVKYTTARGVAERAIDVVLRGLGRPHEASRTAWTPLPGGEGDGAPPADPVARRLAIMHGSRAGDLARRFAEREGWSRPLVPGAPLLLGEVLHAVDDEMARRLADVVLRRTGIGGESCPTPEVLAAVASAMGDRLGWSAGQRVAEIADVASYYRPEETT